MRTWPTSESSSFASTSAVGVWFGLTIESSTEHHAQHGAGVQRLADEEGQEKGRKKEGGKEREKNNERKERGSEGRTQSVMGRGQR